MSTFPDQPRPTTKFAASLDRLSTTHTTRASVVSLPQLYGLANVALELVTGVLPSSLSLFLVVYLSTPHTRTDGLKSYVPVLLIVGRAVGDLAKRRSASWSDTDEPGSDEEKQTGSGLQPRGRRAEAAMAAIEAGLALSLSMAMSGNNTVIGLALLSLTGTRRPVAALLLLTLVSAYSAYVLQGPLGWTQSLGLLCFLGLDMGKRCAGLGGTRTKLGTGLAVLFSLMGSLAVYPVQQPTLAAIFVLLTVLIAFTLNPPRMLSSPTSSVVFLELAVCATMLALIQAKTCWPIAGMLIVGHLLAKQEATESQEETQTQGSSASASKRVKAVAGVVACLAVLISLWRYPGLGMGLIRGELNMVTGRNWRADVDFELAVSHYDEPVDMLADTIRQVRDTLPRMSSSRVTVYSKKIAGSDRQGLQRLLHDVKADEVVALANVGREGETYLQHITRRYNNPRAPLARQTYFLQPHLAWDWVAHPRLKEVHRETGFVSFGPYLNASCTADGSEKDSHGMSYPRVAQIYSMFNGDLCPPTGFSITWAGQFLASRKRIQEVPLGTYANLLGYFDVEKDSTDPKAWIWDEGWWNSKPSDPTLGHWLEASWPNVFRCSQLALADCGEGSGDRCQCRDPVD